FTPSLFLFFLILRSPPRSPLFPYTTLFRSSLEGRPHLVCATAGNFGQGMAYAARKRGLSLTVFASKNANPLKIARMRALGADVQDRKSTRLNSSHGSISYAVFCLKKKNKR